MVLLNGASVTKDSVKLYHGVVGKRKRMAALLLLGDRNGRNRPATRIRSRIVARRGTRQAHATVLVRLGCGWFVAVLLGAGEAEVGEGSNSHDMIRDGLGTRFGGKSGLGVGWLGWRGACVVGVDINTIAKRKEVLVILSGGWGVQGRFW